MFAFLFQRISSWFHDRPSIDPLLKVGKCSKILGRRGLLYEVWTFSWQEKKKKLKMKKKPTNWHLSTKKLKRSRFQPIFWKKPVTWRTIESIRLSLGKIRLLYFAYRYPWDQYRYLQSTSDAHFATCDNINPDRNLMSRGIGPSPSHKSAPVNDRGAYAHHDTNMVSNSYACHAIVMCWAPVHVPTQQRL